MGRRKGELSSSTINHEFPHQVMVLAAFCAGKEGGEKVRIALEGLSVCGRHHSVVKNDEWQTVFCFSDKAHADLFRERFGGEPFDPSSRGRGHSWQVWREPKRKARF
jgi:hypothetical protein